VHRCEIRVVLGLIEDYATGPGVAVALPCNEYFDDHCVRDRHGALGAYVRRFFDADADRLIELIAAECNKRLGPGREERKTADETGLSFGPGRCVLLQSPFGRPVHVALVSTSSQRAHDGITAKASYLFNAIEELASRLADTRITEIVMPVLGGGRGGIAPARALVGLLLAIAEVARQGRRLTRVTVVVFRKDPQSRPEVDPTVIRRALALVASND
jgi:hypothetical protein